MFARFIFLFVAFLFVGNFGFAQKVDVDLGNLYKSKRKVLLKDGVFKNDNLYVTDGFELKVLNLEKKSVTAFDLVSLYGKLDSYKVSLREDFS